MEHPGSGARIPTSPPPGNRSLKTDTGALGGTAGRIHVPISLDDYLTPLAAGNSRASSVDTNTNKWITSEILDGTLSALTVGVC